MACITFGTFAYAVPGSRMNLVLIGKEFVKMGFPQRADVHINGAFSGEEAEDGDEADAAAVTARREAQAGGC